MHFLYIVEFYVTNVEIIYASNIEGIVRNRYSTRLCCDNDKTAAYSFTRLLDIFFPFFPTPARSLFIPNNVISIELASDECARQLEVTSNGFKMYIQDALEYIIPDGSAIQQRFHQEECGYIARHRKCVNRPVDVCSNSSIFY